MEKAGLLDQFKANYRPGAELVRVMDSQAKIWSDKYLAGSKGKFGDKNHRPEIDHGPLRDILLNSLQQDTVTWNSRITGKTGQLKGKDW